VTLIWVIPIWVVAEILTLVTLIWVVAEILVAAAEILVAAAETRLETAALVTLLVIMMATTTHLRLNLVNYYLTQSQN
jgi:hypothetical protein